MTYLQDQDYIREDVESRGGKRLYSSTEAGRAYLEDNRIVIEGILTRVGITAQNQAPQGPPEAVMQALHTLRHAIAVRRTGWSPSDAVRISKIILSAARDIASPAPKPTTEG